MVGTIFRNDGKRRSSYLEDRVAGTDMAAISNMKHFNTFSWP